MAHRPALPPGRRTRSPVPETLEVNLLRGDAIVDRELRGDDAIEIGANNLAAKPEHQATGWVVHGVGTASLAPRFIASMSMPSGEREAAWWKVFAPYFAEIGIDPDAIPADRARSPFSGEAADVLSESKPAVVSFHFGLPSEELLAGVRGWGAKTLSSATTVDEAR
jgi:NAD(P)H-dependent flavin oxidoreductase YrpB (nitropropane dioxygenase family)